MELPIVYSEQHSNGNENFIVRDPFNNKFYTFLYVKESNVNIVFNSQDDLYKFSYVGTGIKRAYIDEADLNALLENLTSELENHIEWIIDKGIDYEQ